MGDSFRSELRMLSNFRQAARNANMKQSEFINWLLKNGFIYRYGGQLWPYERYVPEFFKINSFVRSGIKRSQTLVTVAGMEYFLKILEEEQHTNIM